MSSNLLGRYRSNIKGVISCFDRLVLFGTYATIGYPQAMSKNLHHHGVKLLDYQRPRGQGFANDLRLEVAGHIKQLANKKSIPIQYVQAGQRKEDIVAPLAKKRRGQPGVVCILSAKEGCRTFKVKKNQQSGYLELAWAPGQCIHYYVYFLDADYGLCYLRIPTWAPFRLQFYCNGHDWLERRLKAEGIGYQKADNAFTHISDFARAQEIVDSFDPKALHRRLDEWSAKLVGIHHRWGDNLRWSVFQAEWATDIVFKNDSVLPDLYRELVRTAVLEVQCPDVYDFLGKKLTANSKTEVSNRLNTLVQGTRIKHTLGKSSIKMYDKQKRVLRIETTTSDVTIFKHRREVVSRDGSRKMKHAPMRKTIYSLGALAEAMQAANNRYLSFISEFKDHTKGRHDVDRITRSKRDDKDRSYRGINFFKTEDHLFMLALLRGEYQLQAISNSRLQPHLPGWSASKIGRWIKRMRILGLLKRAGKTYSYYLTALGRKALVAVEQLKERILIPAFA